MVPLGIPPQVPTNSEKASGATAVSGMNREIKLAIGTSAIHSAI
jgi:hypothetical protein